MAQIGSEAQFKSPLNTSSSKQQYSFSRTKRWGGANKSLYL